MASIKQQENGTWRYRIRYKQNGKFKEYSKSGFRLKSEAISEANDMEQRLKKGHNVQDANMLISNYLDMWLKVKRETVKQSSYVRVERSIRLYILPKFGMYKLSELSRLDCVNWISELYNEKKENSEERKRNINSIKSYAATLINALDDAVYEYRLIDSNPMKNLKYPKANKRKSDIEFFEKDTLKQLLTLSKDYSGRSPIMDYQYYVLTYLLSRTGLRLGEALALNWVDIKDNTLSVEKTLYREKEKNYITSPKTESSYRTIQLDKESLELLKRLKVFKMEQSLKMTAPAINSAIIFTDLAGDYLKQSNYRTYFYRMCEKASVPVLSPHALRHSHAVHLLESGSNIKFVSGRLGHATINMTADVYLHISKKMEKDALILYEKYF